MCGIVGAVSRRDVVPILLEGLKRLEYRGYDSAGVAVVNGRLERLRSAGRVAQLAVRVAERGLHGTIGIAHTRWATHGEPTEANAHPHVSGGICVVHNGIVENHEELREKLVRRGYRFQTDTDTEAIAHLVNSHVADGLTLLEAVRASLAEIRGASAIAVISETDPSRMVVARMGAPLLIGLGEHENFAASDAAALLKVTRRVVDLQDGDCAEVRLDGLRVIEGTRGETVTRAPRELQGAADAGDLGSYAHYMEKEIFEQPRAVADTLDAVVRGGSLSASAFSPRAPRALALADSVLVLACGTSYHAGLVARYWIEALAGLPCSVEIASEYRYRQSVPHPGTLVVAVSQSGETADTIAALDHAVALGQKSSLAICNVAESSLVRNSAYRFLTRAGPEIGVASTKAFTTQLATLLALALVLAREQGRLPPAREREALDALAALPAALEAALGVRAAIADWAFRFAPREHALFLGRGVHFPIALEGALKMKEISYIHAEAYAAGELKHGPLALVDARMPVVAVAPRGALLEKLKSNLQEVRARGGELFVVADEDAAIAQSDGVRAITLPRHPALISPIVHSVPLQLLAYHTALCRGNDVDKPRNLAKSVTVE